MLEIFYRDTETVPAVVVLLKAKSRYLSPHINTKTLFIETVLRCKFVQICVKV